METKTSEQEFMSCPFCDNHTEVKRTKGGSHRYTFFCSHCRARAFFSETSYTAADERKLIYLL